MTSSSRVRSTSMNTDQPSESTSSTASASSVSTLVPRQIRRLDEALINRIAAGEIIHRPASALKELLENALDAGSTTLRVTIKDGGLKFLQIQDNGSGIQKGSLPLLATRFATSKISSFSDLSSLQSYGFRGEALASISHVAHLSVITKVRDQGCAWKAHYSDGVLSSPKAGISPDPKPCAGNDGTTITVEDLFYNIPLRLQAMKSTSEEYSRILEVMTKYAVHNSNVSFSCKKASSASPDLSTPSGSTVRQNISLLYGSAVAKTLSHVLISSKPSRLSKRRKVNQLRGQSKKRIKPVNVEGKGKAAIASEDEESVNSGVDIDTGKADSSNECGSEGRGQNDAVESGPEKDNVSWEGEAYVTNSNYHSKKMVFLLFINHRLVESSRLKRAIDSVYSGILPKGTFPFVYLNLNIDPKSVDVNVHPTKREVNFLDEEVITSRVCDAIQETLVEDSGSRTFKYQTLIADVSEGEKSKEKAEKKSTRMMEKAKEDKDETEETNCEDISDIKSRKGIAAQKAYSYQKVRTSATDRTIDSMFPVMNQKQAVEVTSLSSKEHEVKESRCTLTSIRNLRDKTVQSRHEGLTEILKKHVFVGVLDLVKCLSLVQHATKLYIVNHASLTEELFYQLGLRQFGNFGEFRLDPPAPIRTLLSFAVKNEDGIEESGLQKDQVMEAITEILVSRKAMLKEYFSMNINDNSEIEAIPMLLKGYTPNLNKLPLFLMRLGPEVNWKTEQECFRTFLRELAYFYVPSQITPHFHDGSAERNTINGTDEDIETDIDVHSEKWQIQHICFEAMRKYLHAPKKFLERDVVQVANLPDLYKVFERC